jgi:hypothetical protein
MLEYFWEAKLSIRPDWPKTGPSLLITDAQSSLSKHLVYSLIRC